MADVFSYEQGLKVLLERLGQDHPRYTEALTLQSRLFENIAQSERYGDSEIRRAERAQIVDALHRLTQGTVGASFDELHKSEAHMKPVPILLNTPFVGLRPFRPEDTDLFFGREGCLSDLVCKLLDENWPLVVVNGLSGVGKSSLLAAGLVPTLRGKGYAVAWANILDSPESDVLRGIQREFPTSVEARDILQAVNLACPPTRPFFLVVDQVERCFTLSNDSEQILEFWRGIAHLARGDARCPVKVVLAVRSDWLHAFQTITPAPLDIPVFRFLALIAPLNADQAREALVGPLERLSIAYEPELIDAVVSDLVSLDGEVDPPQLQIVGETLYRHTRERTKDQAGEPKLTLHDYYALRGAQAIIRAHLADTVAHLGPDAQHGWQILMKLVGHDNQRPSKRAEDIAGNLTDQVFDRIIANLATYRLVVKEISAADGIPVYTLTHDYLVEEIQHHFDVTLDLQAWKTAERYLDTGLADWQDAQRTTRQELLLERNRYLHVWSQREALGELSEEANELMLRTGLYHGEISFSHWLARLPDHHLATVVDYCVHSDKAKRRTTQKAVIAAIRNHQLPVESQAHLKELLWNQFQAKDQTPLSDALLLPKSERKESTATILWTLRRFARLPEVSRFAPVAARTWIADHKQQVVVSAGSALLVILLVLASLVIRERLRGKWYPINTLFAGPISAAAVSPSEPETLYVITPRGAAAGEGATLLWRRGADQWQMLSSSITYSPVSTMLVTSSHGRTRLYMSIYGKGILRSDDNGTSWELINAGLHSYAIRALVADPLAPNVLLAGSGDKKGVFQSQDGGQRWQDISGGELFGASVISMVYTPYDGGAFLAGTDDGRIVIGKGSEPAWQLASAYPAVGSVGCMSAEPKVGQYVYAGTSNGNVLVSADGGAGWTLVGKAPGVFAVSSIATVPGQPNVVYMDAFGVGGHILWRSENSGQTWHHVTDDKFTREGLTWLLVPEERTHLLYAAGAAGLFETGNGGRSWTLHQDLGTPLAAVQGIAVSIGNGGTTYVAVGGSVYASPDPDAGEWVRGSGLLAIDVRDVVADPRDPAVAYAAVYLPNKWSVFATRDSGRTWQQTVPPQGFAEKYLEDTMAVAVASTGHGSLLYAGSNGCGVLHSLDQGVNWETWGRQDCSLPPSAPKNVLDLALDPSSPGKLYAAADSVKVYVSTDRGRSWEPYPIPLATEIVAIETDPEIEGRVYLIAGSSGFWRSDDGAKTWRSYSTSIEGKPLTAIAVAEGSAGTVFVAAASGEVWKTTDGGGHWAPVRENLAVSSILAMASAGKQILLGGYDGLYRYEPGTLPGMRKRGR